MIQIQSQMKISLIFTFKSLLGKTIATVYIRATIGIIIIVKEVIVPSMPNTLGLYNLLITGDNKIVIA